MAILVDSNILLRSVRTKHPHYAMVEHVFTVLRASNETLHVVTQNYIEFWAVATRPAGSENGLGMTCDAVRSELAILKGLFHLLPEPAGVFDEWERLVTTYRIAVKRRTGRARWYSSISGRHGVDIASTVSRRSSR